MKLKKLLKKEDLIKKNDAILFNNFIEKIKNELKIK